MSHIPKVFQADRRRAGVSADAVVTRHAKRILRRIAHDLRLRPIEHEIVEYPARQLYGCRVELQTPHLLLEVRNTPVSRAVSVSFRTRRGWDDMAGGRENVVPLDQIESPEGYAELLGELQLANGLDITR